MRFNVFERNVRLMFFKKKKRIEALEECLRVQVSNNKFLNDRRKGLVEENQKLQQEIIDLKEELKKRKKGK